MHSTPSSEEDVADLVRAAASARRSMHILGGGTRRLAAPDEGDVLSTSGLTGVTLYEPGALTLVARAGTPLSEIEALLDAENQVLPFEPWHASRITGASGMSNLGGMVATNASGPRRIQAGACRDAMLGVRFVDGTGAIVKNGGRVMKNVTGLDLVKLMAGSRGTLGIITEVSFKVLPKPETVASVVVDNLDLPTAIAAMTTATITPFDVTGAAHAPAGLGDGPSTMVRIEGFVASVAHRARELVGVLSRFGSPRVVDGPGDWAWVRDAAGFAGRDGAVWRISVKPTDGARVAAMLPEAEMLFDWAGGLVWALAPETLDVRAALAGVPGHATLVRGEGAAVRFGVFQPEAGPVAALSVGLRAKFDPAGILNPGMAR